MPQPLAAGGSSFVFFSLLWQLKLFFFLLIVASFELFDDCLGIVFGIGIC